jgi:hypothetical protein
MKSPDVSEVPDSTKQTAAPTMSNIDATPVVEPEPVAPVVEQPVEARRVVVSDGPAAPELRPEAPESVDERAQRLGYLKD